MGNKKTIAEIKEDLLIDDLVGTDANTKKGKDDCVKKLQIISEKLLQEYVICIGDYTIEPLLVEAYYYNEATGFVDDNMHRSEKQKNRFGKLYFHEVGYGGVDICLSNGDYYLSFLIKNSLINGSKESNLFKRQTQLYDLLKGFENSEEFVLKKREDKKDRIVFSTVRKGLVKDNDYKDKKLAAVTGFELRDDNQKRYRFDLETGHSKTKLLNDYIDDYIEKGNKSEKIEEKIRDLCSGLIAKDKLNELLK